MDERRGEMSDVDAAALVPAWIKTTWLDKLTNQHGLSQAAVLWSWVADRAAAGDRAMENIGRRDRGALGGQAEGAAPYWQEASRAEVRAWELMTQESRGVLAEVEERQR